MKINTTSFLAAAICPVGVLVAEGIKSAKASKKEVKKEDSINDKIAEFNRRNAERQAEIDKALAEAGKRLNKAGVITTEVEDDNVVEILK